MNCEFCENLMRALEQAAEEEYPEIWFVRPRQAHIKTAIRELVNMLLRQLVDEQEKAE